MLDRPEHVTVAILSEEEGKSVSVRYALRCVFRDVGFLFRALARHVRRYFGIYARGYRYRSQWWTRESQASIRPHKTENTLSVQTQRCESHGQ